MKNLKDNYEILSYQINPNVVKGLKKLNLSLDEFLLVLYFMNSTKTLDLERINKEISLSNEETLNAYNLLLEKGLIEVKMEKQDGKVIETISLDNLYNKLILSSSNEKPTTDIYSKFESEFGKTLSPIEYETINNWLNNNIDEETILSALKEAVINGVPRLNYIDKIIYEKTKIKTNNNEEYKELYDYDWLGDSDEEE